jgi:Flp pilus assembly pilin Flp
VNPVTYCRDLALSLRGRVAPGERATAFVEYLLLLALIALVCMLAVGVLGDTTNNRYQNIANSVSGA